MWRKRLDPWAREYSAFLTRLNIHVASLNDKELEQLEAATHTPTTTNCWFAVYHVAPIVRDAVKSEQILRQRRAEKVQ